MRVNTWCRFQGESGQKYPFKHQLLLIDLDNSLSRDWLAVRCATSKAIWHAGHAIAHARRCVPRPAGDTTFCPSRSGHTPTPCHGAPGRRSHPRQRSSRGPRCACSGRRRSRAPRHVSRGKARPATAWSGCRRPASSPGRRSPPSSTVTLASACFC